MPRTHGPSILERLWTLLDGMVAEAYRYESAPPELAGEIKGVISCIAIMTNPYSPNNKAIKKEAIRRYREGR